MKLVRDKIPQIMRKVGREAEFTTVSDKEEFLYYLKRKLVEESQEILEAEGDLEIKEELADLLEVYGELVHKLGFGLEEIGEIAQKKFDERGGFEKGILLIKREGKDTRK